MGQVGMVIVAFVALVVGVGAGALGWRLVLQRKSEQERRESEHLLEEARKEAETLKKEAILQRKTTSFA